MSDKAKARHPVPGSERMPLPGARLVGAIDPNEKISVTLVLRRRAGGEIGAHLSGAARQPLTREQFAETLGAAPDDVAAVEAFAHEHGLNVDAAEPAERRVVLSGTVAAMSQTFGVHLGCWEHPGGKYRGRIGDVHVPEDIAPIVEAVLGLDNRPQATRAVPPREGRGRAARRAHRELHPRPAREAVRLSGRCHGQGSDRRHHRARRRLSRVRPQDLLPAHRREAAFRGVGRRGRRRQPPRRRRGRRGRSRHPGGGRGGAGGAHRRLLRAEHRPGILQRDRQGDPRPAAQAFGRVDQLGRPEVAWTAQAMRAMDCRSRTPRPWA